MEEMATWEKVAGAVLLLVLLFFIYPRAKQQLKDGPKGSASDWKGVLIPLLAVILFVFLLIQMV